MIHQILKAKVGIIVFSVDAYDQAGYKKIRNSDLFDRVVENIKRFHQIRKEHYPDSIVITRAHGVKVDPDFDHQKFYSFWKDITDEVTLNQAAMRWDSYNNLPTNKSELCSVGLDRLYVWYDGTYNPCDYDYKSKLSPGNIKDQTIAEVWNGEKYKQFREAHLNGKRSTLIPCDRCEL